MLKKNANIVQDGRDQLDLIMANLFSSDNLIEFPTSRRGNRDIENSTESVFADVISKKIEQKGLPLALRKRLMYERSFQS